MSGVIFLDFDGPIFPEKIHLFPQNQGKVANDACRKMDLHPHVMYWYADPFAIAVLNELRKVQPYKLVISSSWADDRLHQRHHIEEVLKVNGLEYDMHEDWRTPRNPELVRHQQIEQWLAGHPEITTNYLIFDDTKSAPDLFFAKTYESTPILRERVFLAHEKDGFNYEQFDEMKWIMQEHWEPKPNAKRLITSSMKN
jgi:HAD domain in Swiss Army Knife RNA repair proteins